MTKLPGYYTVEEAAPVLKIHPESLRRIIRGGKLSAYTVGNVQLIPAAELNTFAAGYSARHKTATARRNYQNRIRQEGEQD